MIYEIEITLRTVRHEGLGSFFKKVRAYIYHFFYGIFYFFVWLPRNATPETLVDFSFRTSHGLLQLVQARSEIIALAKLIKDPQCRTVIEIDTAHRGLIVFHDICKHAEQMNCHVDRFWQEVKVERCTREFVHDWNQGIFGIGVIEV